MIALGFALVAILSGQAPTFRDPPGCWDGSQREMNYCAHREFMQADEAMNAQWGKTAALMKRIDADAGAPNDIIGNSSHFEALLNGQRAWLAYRDAYCPILGASGGSSKPMLIHICRRDLTRQRTKQLNALMLHPMSGNPYFEGQ